jgi:hypothetical protein
MSVEARPMTMPRLDARATMPFAQVDKPAAPHSCGGGGCASCAAKCALNEIAGKGGMAALMDRTRFTFSLSKSEAEEPPAAQSVRTAVSQHGELTVGRPTRVVAPDGMGYFVTLDEHDNLSVLPLAQRKRKEASPQPVDAASTEETTQPTSETTATPPAEKGNETKSEVTVSQDALPHKPVLSPMSLLDLPKVEVTEEKQEVVKEVKEDVDIRLAEKALVEQPKEARQEIAPQVIVEQKTEPVTVSISESSTPSSKQMVPGLPSAPPEKTIEQPTTQLKTEETVRQESSREVPVRDVESRSTESEKEVLSKQEPVSSSQPVREVETSIIQAEGTKEEFPSKASSVAEESKSTQVPSVEKVRDEVKVTPKRPQEKFVEDRAAREQSDVKHVVSIHEPSKQTAQKKEVDVREFPAQTITDRVSVIDSKIVERKTNVKPEPTSETTRETSSVRQKDSRKVSTDEIAIPTAQSVNKRKTVSEGRLSVSEVTSTIVIPEMRKAPVTESRRASSREVVSEKVSVVKDKMLKTLLPEKAVARVVSREVLPIDANTTSVKTEARAVVKKDVEVPHKVVTKIPDKQAISFDKPGDRFKDVPSGNLTKEVSKIKSSAKTVAENRSQQKEHIITVKKETSVRRISFSDSEEKKSDNNLVVREKRRDPKNEPSKKMQKNILTEKIVESKIISKETTPLKKVAKPKDVLSVLQDQSRERSTQYISRVVPEITIVPKKKKKDSVSSAHEVIHIIKQEKKNDPVLVESAVAVTTKKKKEVRVVSRKRKGTETHVVRQRKDALHVVKKRETSVTKPKVERRANTSPKKNEVIRKTRRSVTNIESSAPLPTVAEVVPFTIKNETTQKKKIKSVRPEGIRRVVNRTEKKSSVIAKSEKHVDAVVVRHEAVQTKKKESYVVISEKKPVLLVMPEKASEQRIAGAIKRIAEEQMTKSTKEMPTLSIKVTKDVYQALHQRFKDILVNETVIKGNTITIESVDAKFSISSELLLQMEALLFDLRDYELLNQLHACWSQENESEATVLCSCKDTSVIFERVPSTCHCKKVKIKQADDWFMTIWWIITREVIATQIEGLTMGNEIGIINA